MTALRPGTTPLPPAAPDVRPGLPPAARAARSAGPVVTELRLSAFASHRGTVLPIGPLTLLAGATGTGKSSALRAYEALARLGAGDPLAEVFPDPEAYVPERAGADAQGRRGFRIGCTTDGPAGPVRLDLAVQAEPTLRIVGERLTGGGETLLTTALRDPGRSTVQAAWHTAGAVPVTRAPLPDDMLGTALLPLRVAGTTEGQVRALVERDGGHRTPVGRLGDGELRYLALALVLLTGPGVLAMEAAGEVPSAMQTLTVLADGLDRDLDGRQLRRLLALAASIGAAGHLRLVGTITEAAASEARGTAGVTVVDLDP
ncbi:ATP-binding protein [Streptomyces sp900116325]|uniref:ATP-binding protein n=1 Tax=Streptomyces sp. 900116325 TaxID=3154295 RepID=UPI00332D83EA